MKRLLLITAFLAAAASAAQATTYTYTFTDVAKPHGHVRGAAIRHADGRACGASASLDMPKNIPAFERCMAKKGWRFARVIVSNPAAVARGASSSFEATPSTSDDDAAQAEEEANDAAARDSAWQAQQAEETQDMIDTENGVDTQNAIAAQEQATAAAAASFDAQMTVGNQ